MSEPSVEQPPAVAADTSRTIAMLVGIAALGFLVRLIPVLRGGGLHGLIDYDDGVYFGAALALLQGHVAYRDFILLHPPGILYVLAPFAALQFVASDATAFAVARIGFMVLGALNIVLVGLVAMRLGRTAAVSAAALYGVWQVPANVERTTWLIAPQNTLLLLALLALSAWTARPPERAGSPSLRRVAVVGALLGLSADMQIWGVVPIAVVLAWLTLGRRVPWPNRVRLALAFTGGAAGAIALLWLPFLLAAGAPMIRDVIIDQIGRSAVHRDIITRLRGLEGLPIKGPGAALVPTLLVESVFVAAAAAIGIAARRLPEIRLWTVLLAAQTAVLFVAPSFFAHYAGWIAPAAALAFGVAAERAIRATTARLGRRDGAEGRRGVRLILPAAYIAALGCLAVVSVGHRVGVSASAAAISAAVGNARCVTADSPTLLIESGLLRRDLLRGCPLLLDTTGVSYDLDPSIRGASRKRLLMPQYQQAMRDYYGSSDAALFMRGSDNGLTPETWAAIRAQLPRSTQRGVVTLLLR